MTARTFGLSAALCLGLVGAGTGAALAQDAPQDQPAAQNQQPAQAPAVVKGLESVTVTSQKKEEDIQSVPIAVTALTGDAIAQAHAVNLEGLQGAVPNVQIGHFANTPHTAVFNIRGMGVIEPDPYAGNTVSIVTDGVPQYFNMVALLNLYDIERVEILRGPQGTLFGANTTGGVVNVVTAQPTGEFGGKASVTVGNQGRLDGDFSVDFPIIENVLAGKVSFMHHGSDGYIRNVYDGTRMGGVQDTAGRVYLKYDKGGNFDATLQTEYVLGRGDSPVVVNGAVPGEALFVPAGTQEPGWAMPMYESPCVPAGERCHAPKGKLLAANDSVPNTSNLDMFSSILTMNWDTSAGKFTSITGYKKFRLREFTDQDGTPVFLDDTDRRTEGYQLTQELRDDFHIGESVEVLLGGFLMIDHYQHYQNYRIPFAAYGLRQLTDQDQKNWSGSLFMQSYIDLTDTLRLQAGVRYTHEKTRMTVGINNFSNCLEALGIPDAGCNGNSVFSGDTYIGGFLADGDQDLDFTTASKSWDNIGAKVGLDWHATDDMLLYAYYARGFKSGGFVGRIIIPQDIGPYNPEHVDTIEAGIKSDWLDNRLRVNVSAFRNWYHDLQLALIYFAKDPNGNTVNGNSILNAAQAITQGFELEVETVPVDGLTISGSLAYLDAHYTEFPYLDPVTGTTTDLSGNRLQNAPKWNATIGFRYQFTAGPGEASVGMQYKYVSSKYNTSLLNTPRALIQATNIVDANVDWTPDNGRWSVGLYGRNLFDKHYIAAVFDAPGVFGLTQYAPTREYGVSFRYNF